MILGSARRRASGRPLAAIAVFIGGLGFFWALYQAHRSGSVARTVEPEDARSAALAAHEFVDGTRSSQSARVERDAGGGAENRGDPDRSSLWRRCIEPDSMALDLRECLRSALLHGTPTGHEIAIWACGESLDGDLERVVVEELLRSIPARSALPFIEAFQSDCGMTDAQILLRPCLSALARSDPGWVRAFLDQLAPDQLFDAARGTAAVDLLAVLANTDGGEWGRILLEEGGRGRFGGSPAQVSRAATIALSTMAARGQSEAALEYVVSVLDSTSVPEGSTVGQSFIALLCSTTGEYWPEGDAEPALVIALEVLRDRRFSTGAAAQFLANFADSPPRGWDTTLWRHLVEAAREALGPR